MSAGRTIQLHEPRQMLANAQEHLPGPASKLLALERLLSTAAKATQDRTARLVEWAEGPEMEGDVLLGLSRILRDVREEIDAIYVADFTRPDVKAKATAGPRPAAGGAR